MTSTLSNNFSTDPISYRVGFAWKLAEMVMVFQLRQVSCLYLVNNLCNLKYFVAESMHIVLSGFELNGTVNTTEVMLGWTVYLTKTTLSWAGLVRYAVDLYLCTFLTVENISQSISMKECCQTQWELNPQPDHKLDVHESLRTDYTALGIDLFNNKIQFASLESVYLVLQWMGFPKANIKWFLISKYLNKWNISCIFAFNIIAWLLAYVHKKIKILNEKTAFI